MWDCCVVTATVCVTLGAVFFVKPIRAKRYVTLMDPFQQKYGNTVAAALFIPCILADILWAACILGILGKSGTSRTRKKNTRNRRSILFPEGLFRFLPLAAEPLQEQK